MRVLTPPYSGLHQLAQKLEGLELRSGTQVDMDTRQLRGAVLMLGSLFAGARLISWLLLSTAPGQGEAATPVALVLAVPTVLVAVHLFWFASEVAKHN